MKNKLLILTIVLFILNMGLVQAATLTGTIYDYELEQVENVLLEIDTQPIQQYLSKDGTYSLELPTGDYTLRASKGDLITEETISVTSEGTFVYDLFLFPIIGDEGEITPIENEENKTRWWAYLAAIGIILVLVGRIIIARKKYPQRKSLFGRKKKGIQEVNLKDNSEEKELETEPKSEGKTIIVGIPEDVENEQQKIDSEPKKSLTREEKLASIKEELENNETPGYIKRALDVIKTNDGRITQKELRKEMMDISESKVSLIITELEHKGKIEKVKRGRGNIILLKE
ncbi:MAG: hypothetical protein ABIG93_02835 [archaeon]|nr:hypothetical protein [Nanoarchaeota archaeon]